ncbi:MAG TPA: hypothetical protein VIW46_12245, partial [Acidimicrobiia bacterium]
DGGLTYAGTLVAPNGSWDDVTVRVTDPNSTSARNHGQWVAASVARDGRPDAHSCVGMPVVSKGKTR